MIVEAFSLQQAYDTLDDSFGHSPGPHLEGSELGPMVVTMFMAAGADDSFEWCDEVSGVRQQT